MNDINNVVVTGRLTKAPEFIDKGTFQIAKFSIAINYNYKKDGEWQTDTTYIDCNAWNALAEIVNRVAGRGAKVSVEGRLVQENWVSKEGQNRSKLTLRASKFNKIMDAPTRNSQPELNETGGEDSSTAEMAADIF